MPNLVVAVLPNLDRCQEVLSTWERMGVTGVTILESIGLHRLKQAFARRDDLPLIPSLRHLTESEEYHHRTVFVVLGDEFDIDRFLADTEASVGDFNAG